MADEARVPPTREPHDETQAPRADLRPEVAARAAETNRHVDSARFRLDFLGGMDEHLGAFHESIENVRGDLADLRRRR